MHCVTIIKLTDNRYEYLYYNVALKIFHQKGNANVLNQGYCKSFCEINIVNDNYEHTSVLKINL